MAGKHRKTLHRPAKCNVCMKHLKSLGSDILVGLAIVLLPMVESEEFEVSAAWWDAASGILVRRLVVIVLTYVIKVLMPKKEEEEDSDEPDTGNDSGDHPNERDDPVPDR